MQAMHLQVDWFDVFMLTLRLGLNGEVSVGSGIQTSLYETAILAGC